MALTQINGNQISTSTSAIIDTLAFLDSESIFRLPTGTTAQRPTGVSYGTMRFNLDEDAAEIYVTNADGQGTDGWTLVGSGGPSKGRFSQIRTSANYIDEVLTIGPSQGDKFTNGLSIGPITISNGASVTVAEGGVWYIYPVPDELI